MNLPLAINTIQSSCEFKMKEKGSQFIGMSVPILTVDEANEKLDEIRKQFYDATHHCYAYKLSDGKTKYSDDGEPSGTAGIRIFNSINHFELSDLVVIVIRYFGGTKLGVGPLGKAYYDCSFNCLDSATRISKTLYGRIVIEYQFEFSNLIHRTLSKYSAKIELNLFEGMPQIHAILPSENINKLIEEIQSASNSKIKTEIKDDILYI